MKFSATLAVLFAAGAIAAPNPKPDAPEAPELPEPEVAITEEYLNSLPEASEEEVASSIIEKRYANHNIRDCAAARIGGKYVWGGGNINGPTGGGFDCSGLTTYCAYQGTKIKLPRTSKTQYTYGSGAQKIPYSQRSVGNLVFYGCGTEKGIHHVGVVDHDINFYISAYSTKRGIIRTTIEAKDLCRTHVLQLGTK